jgi:uncharacterized ferredoxin-like protein
MTVYSLMLFLHVGAALALASALSIDALIMVQCGVTQVPVQLKLVWIFGEQFPG